MGFMSWPSERELAEVAAELVGGRWSCSREQDTYYLRPDGVIGSDAARKCVFVFNVVKRQYFGFMSPGYLCVEVESSGGETYRHHSLTG